MEDLAPKPSSTIHDYEAFANDPSYRSVNQELVGLLHSIMPSGLNGKRVADVACGTGLIAELCLQVAAPAHIFCSDIDAKVIEVAKANLMQYSLNTRLEFQVADAQSLPLEQGSIDALIIANAIHNIEGKEAVAREAARTLAPGGYLAMNTAFYDGCYVGGDHRPWLKWSAAAIRYIRANGLAVERDHTEVFAMKWLKPQDYKQLLELVGFKVVQMTQVTVRLVQTALQAIAQYKEFAAGAFSINPSHPRAVEYTRNASQALATVVERAFPPEGIYRNWLQIVAQKA